MSIGEGSQETHLVVDFRDVDFLTELLDFRIPDFSVMCKMRRERPENDRFMNLSYYSESRVTIRGRNKRI